MCLIRNKGDVDVAEGVIITGTVCCHRRAKFDKDYAKFIQTLGAKTKVQQYAVYINVYVILLCVIVG